MKTTLIHTVELSFFEDEANGEFGVAHTKTFDNSNNPFNAFWNGIGIFHDVFEHWFELEHKYFMNNNGLNVGGEMAAMGAAFYYYYELNVINRSRNNYIPFSESIRQTTESEVLEAINYGYTNFGATLECGVPRQRPLYNSELEYQIEKLYNNAKNAIYDEQSYSDEDEQERSKQYKKSVTLGKIANLYRWGYRMAEKLIPDNRENQITCTEFINFFNEFCANNSAETLTNLADKMTIQLFKNHEDEITWKAFLTLKDGIIFNIEHSYGIVEDIYILDEMIEN